MVLNIRHVQLVCMTNQHAIDVRVCVKVLPMVLAEQMLLWDCSLVCFLVAGVRADRSSRSVSRFGSTSQIDHCHEVAGFGAPSEFDDVWSPRSTPESLLVLRPRSRLGETNDSTTSPLELPIASSA